MKTFGNNRESQKIYGINFGINKLRPINDGYNYQSDLGFQLGLFSRNKKLNSFTFEKGINFTVTKFHDLDAQKKLVFKNTTYSLSFPLNYYWNRIKFFHPYAGVEGIWRFYNDSDYYIQNANRNKVSILQLALSIGSEIILKEKLSFNTRYSLTPYFLSIGKLDLYGFQFSLNYKF